MEDPVPIGMAEPSLSELEEEEEEAKRRIQEVQ